MLRGKLGLPLEVTVEYRSNNSGGYWWLTDDQWRTLERAGWKVKWRPTRWLGALATEASKAFLNEDAAREEWERVTGMDASDPGCSCCGNPHNFREVN